MAGNANYNDLLTTTLEERSGVLKDNVTKNNALLKRLSERGKIRQISGGTKIVEELEYGEGDMVWYNGYDTISYTPKQLFSAAEYSMKMAAVPVAISGEDLLKNSGQEAVMDLFEKRIDNAFKTMKNQFSAAIYGDGTGNGGKEIGGLKLLVADNPATGVVGGIDRSAEDNKWWRNQATTLASALDKDNIFRAFSKAYQGLVRGSDAPDLIVTGDTIYGIFEESLGALQRFTTSSMADAGYKTLKFKGADVICDGGQGGHCPDDHVYFLNTNYIYLRPHKDRNMKVVGGDRMAINQDVIYKLIGWAGNMTLSNAALQGVLINPAE